MAGVAGVLLDHVDENTPHARRAPALELVPLRPVEPAVRDGFSNEHAGPFDRRTPVLPGQVRIIGGAPLPVAIPAAVVDQVALVASNRDVEGALWIVSVRGVRRLVPPAT